MRGLICCHCEADAVRRSAAKVPSSAFGLEGEVIALAVVPLVSVSATLPGLMLLGWGSGWARVGLGAGPSRRAERRAA